MTDESQGLSSTAEFESAALRRRQLIEARVERVGWLVMAAIIAAALGGLLGQGPASRRVSRSAAGAITLDYDAVVRCDAPAELHITLDRPSLNAGLPDRSTPARLAIGRAFTDNVMTEEMAPGPISAAVDRDSIIYELGVIDSTSPAEVVLRYRPQHWGTLVIEMEFGGESISVKQRVFP